MSALDKIWREAVSERIQADTEQGRTLAQAIDLATAGSSVDSFFLAIN